VCDERRQDVLPSRSEHRMPCLRQRAAMFLEGCRAPSDDLRPVTATAGRAARSHSKP
jgi:hypothetical protein